MGLQADFDVGAPRLTPEPVETASAREVEPVEMTAVVVAAETPQRSESGLVDTAPVEDGDRAGIPAAVAAVEMQRALWPQRRSVLKSPLPAADSGPVPKDSQGREVWNAVISARRRQLHRKS